MARCRKLFKRFQTIEGWDATMRLDYPLYILAIVFFFIASLSAVLVVEQTEKILWSLTTLVLGFVFVGAGYAMKPKAKAPVIQPPTTMPCQPPPEPAPAAAATAETPVPEAPKAEAPVAPVAEAPKVEAPPMIEAPKVETPMLEKPEATEALPPAQVEECTAEAQVVEGAAAPKSDLTRIRGINEKRAEQLMANGISSIKDLAAASPTELAAKLNVSEKIVKMWIGCAKKLAQ